MKKLWTGLGIVIVILALGTSVYASTSEGVGFREMLPFMKQMHPNTSKQQLEDMYKTCHGQSYKMPGNINIESHPSQ